MNETQLIRVYRSDAKELEALKWKLAGEAQRKRTVADAVHYLLEKTELVIVRAEQLEGEKA